MTPSSDAGTVEAPLRYPVQFEPDDTGLLITFPDIPEAISHGKDLAEAREMAQDALITALEFYFDDQRPVPLPSVCSRSAHFVELPPDIAAKVMLLNRVSQGL